MNKVTITISDEDGDDGVKCSTEVLFTPEVEENATLEDLSGAQILGISVIEHLSSMAKAVVVPPTEELH